MKSSHYTATAIALHWVMALGISGLMVVGVYMHDLPLSPQKLQLYAWHKWAGVCLFLLAIIRLLWRLTHRPPALPETMSAPARLMAHAGHGLLYALILLIPLSGWLMSSAKGFQTVLFSVLPIPDAVQKNSVLGDLLQTVHGGLNLALAFLLAGHLAAAFWHHRIAKDDILRRMLPRRFFSTSPEHTA